MPELSDSYATQVMAGVEEFLMEEGYFYLTASHRRKPDLIQEYPRLLMDRSVEGFIFIDTVLDEMLSLPTVVVAGHKKIEGVTNVVLDQKRAAELALVESYAQMPEAIDFAGAAALPVAVETAVRALDELKVGGGQTIVINGASGSVGIAAVQCARARGARVIGTASAANQDYVRDFGAEPTTYGDGLVQRVGALVGDDGVDRALDASGGGMLPALVQLTGSPEHVLTIADYAGAEATGVTFSGGPGTPRAWYALADVAQLIEEGRFRLPVAQTFPLADIAEAHRISESGHPRGKLVLTVD